MPPSRTTEQHRIHVAAAVIENAAGEILVARRPDHAHQGGLWEFPGGKVEPGEAVERSLRRELHEELGIDVATAVPLIRIHHDYPDRAVTLDVWRVTGFGGEAHGREGQPVRWVAPDELTHLAFPAANLPIVTAARLPARCLITGDCADRQDFLRRLTQCLERGIRLVQLRARELPEGEFLSLARDAVTLCREHHAALLLNAAPALVAQAGAHGVHLTAARLRTLAQRPLDREHWVSASVHDGEELDHAERIGVDFVFVAPVLATASHPGAPTLGWDGLQRLTEQANCPVYALGGMGESLLGEAQRHGAQGIAAISAFWNGEDSR